MNKGWRRRAVGRLVGALLCALALAACIPFLEAKRPSEIWEIPEGFHGLIVVRYSDPSCSPLPRSGQSPVYQVPHDGQMCTSDKLPTGSAIDRFEVVYDNGTRVELHVPEEVDMLATVNGNRLYVYVGPPAEQQDARRKIR